MLQKIATGCHADCMAMHDNWIIAGDF